jgi:hypothetical protein
MEGALQMGLTPPPAIQPSQTLLEDFKGAKPPNGPEHLELLLNYNWFIDDLIAACCMTNSTR